MKTIIIYHSKTGFTKRYAEWIQEQLNAELIPFKEKGKIVLNEYDNIIFGGGFHAGMILGAAWVKNQLPLLNKNQKVVVFATGATPPEAEDVPKALAQNFTESESKRIKTFYFQSGLNYEKMGLFDKLLMKGFRSMLKKTEGESEAYKMVQSSYDASSREQIAPLIAYLNSVNEN